MERPPWKCFRCGSEDHMIAKCPKPLKDNDKRRRQVRFNEKGNRACDNGENNYDHKIYRNSERAHAVQTKCTFCGGNNNFVAKILQKDKKG